MRIGYWILGPFVYGRLQSLQTSEVTFAHVIIPLWNRRILPCQPLSRPRWSKRSQLLLHHRRYGHPLPNF